MFRLLISLISFTSFCLANPDMPQPPPDVPPDPAPITIPNIVNFNEWRGKIADFYEIYTCQKAQKDLSRFSHFDSSRPLKVINSSHNANITREVCQFPVNAMDLVLREQMAPSWAASISEVPWFCKVNANNYCNTMSECLTDECGCTNSSMDVFFCPKRTGCITFPQLCNGNIDCLDGADECFCEGFVEVKCPILSSSSICLSQNEYCKRKDTISELNNSCIFRNIENVDCSDSAISDNENHLINPIDRCINNNIVHLVDIYNNGDISSYCKTNCNTATDFGDGNWDKFCDRIVLQNMGVVALASFTCTPVYYKETCPLSKLCDGELDCSNGADEAQCPGRFYCSLNISESTEWVTPDKTCDNVKHCSNGRDECDPCSSDNSSDILLSSYFLLAFTAIAGVSMIILNLRGGIICFKNTPSTSAGKVDRFLCLQVFFFDGSMGLYNCGVVVAALVLRANGNYCFQDENWRSSIVCQVLGLIFSIASHGSLGAIAVMSVVRCVNCIRVHHQTKLKTIFITSAILIAINVINALIPILPLVVVQNIFRTDVFFKNFLDNPFISSSYVNMTWLDHIHERYYSNKTDLYTTVRDLNTITSKDKIFDIIEIGYYGNTRLCVHNVFKEQESYIIYKLSYLITVSLLLVIVTLTYIIIVRKQLESRREVGDIGGGMNRQNTAAPSLALKVSLMIGTQLASWLSFIGAAVYFQIVSDSPPHLLFEVLALVVLPINSILNPIFYSELYKNIFYSNFWRSWRGFVSRMH